MIMTSIYDLDEVGFVGGQFKEPEEDAAYFTAYFKELKAKQSAQEKENPKTVQLYNPGRQKVVM
jgi:cytochrome c1